MDLLLELSFCLRRVYHRDIQNQLWLQLIYQLQSVGQYDYPTIFYGCYNYIIFLRVNMSVIALYFCNVILKYSCLLF